MQLSLTLESPTMIFNLTIGGKVDERQAAGGGALFELLASRCSGSSQASPALLSFAQHIYRERNCTDGPDKK
jgi:hypothetical protein